MARFLHHTSCPKCNSRDNLAIYDDGSSWCFGCSRASPPTISPYILENDEEYIKPFPKDLTYEYSKLALDWTMKYGIPPNELISRRVAYSPERVELCFRFFPTEHPNDNSIDTRESLLESHVHRNHQRRVHTFDQYRENGENGKNSSKESFACARRLSDSKQKYTIYGKKESFCLYKKSTATGLRPELLPRRILAIVEDCLSAIKIARQVDCMPLLTSTLPIKDLVAVAGLWDVFLIWLDGNMFHKAQGIARKFQLLGKTAKAIYTPLDPKEYDDDTIGKTLQDTESSL
jgi:hypothetical protein